jgi:large subunit ribosomal protein L15
MDEQSIPVLSRLSAPPGAVRNKKRVGRGVGSGLGKTAGRGQKGQKARQPGNFHKKAFEGGQMPLARRIPKMGFRNIFAPTVATVNVGALQAFPAGSIVDSDALRAAGLVKGRPDLVKILGAGSLDGVSLVVRADAFSAGARQKIEAAGGQAELLHNRSDE